ncbi:MULTISPECIES: endopeptidase La [unclassified Fusibacter]|uniref:endopeptidase La n=1 Tax=unclassified Fusibacter TaxID=2624464 RepID=UPI00101086DA|nr:MULTISPECIES: endopeptidase La [unclassified Fusibacter]MCK8060369.1 endopeptidase La [Fusibacter sp. A2]NPE20342.1 endopeptidase La [Fusibacter sp. A1]RXV63548.1 endopeptidase La [Fusibacter sp. A1]
MNKLLIPLRNIVLFSGKEMQITADSPIDFKLFEAIRIEGGSAIAFTLKDYHEKLRTKEDVYLIGNLVEVHNVSSRNNLTTVQLYVKERVELLELIPEENHFRGIAKELPDIIDIDAKSESDILKYIKETTAEIAEQIKGSERFQEALDTIDNLNEMIATLMPFMNLSIEEKQDLMEMVSLRKRSLRMIDLLIERKEYIKFQVELQSKMSKDMNKAYRERMLREQLKAIQEELGEYDESGLGKDYEKLIEEKYFPEEVKKIAREELAKLKRMGPNQAESNVIKSYLELLLDLEWAKAKVKPIAIENARSILDEHHYGMQKIKDRVVQHLTVMKLKNEKQGSILLLVGPPGTGKTSLAKSIAKTLDRAYVRASLGGVRDEAEIRGHRRTYIGAMPGKIIQGMKRSGTNNPVFVLDEVDKLGSSFQGDPSSALLEVLDPEQNNTFMDHYLDVPYDLSDVFFIATANDLRTIPGALVDRLEVIQVDSYTSTEKFHIAVKHLFDQELEEHGLTRDDLLISDDTFRLIIDKYTREAGVRTLKRQIAKIIRVSAEKIVTNQVDKPYVIEKEMLNEILGHEITRYDMVADTNKSGVVTGLAWTPVGGDVLFIESAFMPGKGELILTGQLGDVMKESARISLSLVRANLSDYVMDFKFETHDLHIHIPAGATPKDGPSAGVTLFTTIASLVTGIAVDAKLAMTGEISLRGAVLPVGGIKEKVIAAHRSGIKRVMLPYENKQDLEDVPAEVKDTLLFEFAKTIDDVLSIALGIESGSKNMKPDTIDLKAEHQELSQ